MPTPELELVALHEATRQRYLNYAMSVITSRALPDVRDGLKPVQRRILYAMYNNLRLLPDARFRKSAAVVGEVMARYHPHGDTSIYDALVRMAQPFSLRHTLVDGQGNFGSLDGDSAAAMRYTECRLTRLAVELISEIGQRTVDFRPNYDGQHSEPVVLPAQFPQILVNGAEGIAVGMATRIPPHNLREVIDATILVLDNPDTEIGPLLKKVTGPDFPTGGVVLNSQEEIRQLYETGSGTLRLRGEWTTEQKGRKHHAIITSLPYGVIKAQLVEKIGKLISEKKVPQLLDVRDESTDIVRVVLELRRPEDAEAAMAWLFKHTTLQTTFPANLTVLLPGENPEIAEPARVDLLTLLVAWVKFRLGTVRRRFEYELEQIRKRIHILIALEKIFNALDEAIALIRKAEGKRDAAERLINRFALDDEQADAILELRLYKLAKLEIQAIRDELAEKRAEEARIMAILASEPALRDVVRTELLELRKLYGEPRRTVVGGAAAADLQYSEDAYIVAEKAAIIVTRDGWIKRQASFTGIEKIRVREGDSIGWLALGRTTSHVTFFTDRGGAYTLRIEELPSTSGYGEPVQRHFQFEDGERVVGVVVHDPSAQPAIRPDVRASYTGEDPPPPHGVAVSRHGRILRFPLEAHKEASTRAGRRYMRLDDGDSVFAAYLSDGTEAVCLCTEGGRAVAYPVVDVSLVRGAGKGVTGIKLNDGDRVYAFQLSPSESDGIHVKLPSGRDEIICQSKHAGSRGDKGEVLFKRGRLNGWEPPMIRYDLLVLPDLFQGRPGEEV